MRKYDSEQKLKAFAETAETCALLIMRARPRARAYARKLKNLKMLLGLGSLGSLGKTYKKILITDICIGGFALVSLGKGLGKRMQVSASLEKNR